MFQVSPGEPTSNLQFPAGAASANNEPYHHGDLRQTLIAAALTLLTEEQDWSFSLREVARRAGVSHNAPYNHFGCKQDLLAAVAAEGYERLRARMETAAALSDSSAATLRAIGMAYVRFGVENPAHYRLMFGAALAPSKSALPAALVESAAAAKGVLSDVIRRGAENGSFAVSPTNAEALDLAVLSVWSLVHGLTMLLNDCLAGAGATDPLTTAERIAGQVTQLLIDGIHLAP